MKFKILIICILLFSLVAQAQELKIKAKLFNSDQKKGITTFSGNVNIVKENDELNASKVTVYTDKEQQPVKYVAEGNVSFYITTEEGSVYRGKAQRTIYLPKTEEYYFYEKVHLTQVGEKKEIIGDEVVLKSIDGKAYAKSKSDKPVIMIFDIQEKEK